MNQLLLITVLVLLPSATAHAQIFRVAEMNTEQIRALDKAQTVVILTGGILEEHGPHLPSFADGYSNEWLARENGRSDRRARPARSDIPDDPSRP